MKITLFTANRFRHNHLINLLSGICDDLFVIQECGTIFPGEVPGYYPATEIMQKYFHNVNEAQKKYFGSCYINSQNNIKILPILSGDLNKCNLEILSDFLNSDLYIVFGSSYIKGDLIDFLTKKKAINIHMGVSPYYRGNDCNFWALYDGNPHLVGSTIHLLSKGLDNGEILYHAMPDQNIKNPFEYTMSAVKSAFNSLIERIKDRSIFEIKSLPADKSKEIRYSKKINFNERVLIKYFDKNIDLKAKKFNAKILKDPFFL